MSALPKQSYANISQPLFQPFGSGGGGSTGPTGSIGPTGSSGSTGPTGAAGGGSSPSYYSFRITQGQTITGGFGTRAMPLTQYAQSGTTFLSSPVSTGKYQINTGGLYRIDLVSGGTECEETESSVWVNILDSSSNLLEQSVATGGQGCYGAAAWTVVQVSSNQYFQFNIRCNAAITTSSSNDFRYAVLVSKL